MIGRQTFAKRGRAKRANERALRFEREGQTEDAITAYERACRLDPEWSEPFYNLGLLYKYASEWELSLENNLRATELCPEDQAGWWNLGIAATALSRWQMARFAWRGAGIEVADGDGPIEHPCGSTPIRLNPDADAEVVWSERLDPARALIRNIPMPESGFRFGDIVLNDGAATGYRKLDGLEVPVFNCLGLLVASRFSTWVAEIELLPAEPAGDESVELLCELAHDRDLAAEDWSSSLELLCKACSEGRPFSDHEHVRADAGRRRKVAIAAPDARRANALLDDWKARIDVAVSSFAIALDAGLD
jgi:tetratricopeptide (TPR) repeat protein